MSGVHVHSPPSPARRRLGGHHPSRIPRRRRRRPRPSPRSSLCRSAKQGGGDGDGIARSAMWYQAVRNSVRQHTFRLIFLYCSRVMSALGCAMDFRLAFFNSAVCRGRNTVRPASSSIECCAVSHQPLSALTTSGSCLSSIRFARLAAVSMLGSPSCHDSSAAWAHA